MKNATIGTRVQIVDNFYTRKHGLAGRTGITTEDYEEENIVVVELEGDDAKSCLVDKSYLETPAPVETTL